MDRATFAFASVVVGLLAMHACSQYNFSYSISDVDYQALGATPTPNGMRYEIGVGEQSYFLDLEKVGRTHFVTVSSSQNNIGLWTAVDDEQGPRARNLFVVYPDSGIADVALDLASRPVVEELAASNPDASAPYSSAILFRSLPGPRSSGEFMAVKGDGGVSFVAMDNGATTPSGPRYFDTPSNNCSAKVKDYRDCQLQSDDCSAEREEAELACSLDTHPAQGNFSDVVQ